ncbi:MAG: PAS domain-containing protein [Thermoplasmata archaeon]
MTIKVLLIDSEQSALEASKRHLEKHQEIEVEASESLEDAKLLVSRKEFDVIVSEYQMSDGTGIDFLKHLRSSNVQVPFILFTGRNQEEIFDEALSAGMDSYIPKRGQPEVQFAQLQMAVERFADAQKSRRELRELQWQLRSILDNIPAYVFVKDLEGRYLVVNKKFCDFACKPEQEMLGKTSREFFPKEFSDWTENEERQVLETGKTLYFHESRDFRGKTMNVAVTKIPIKDSEGKITAIATFAFDNEDLAKMERALSKQVQLFNNVLESVQDGLCILDKDLNVLYSNPAMNVIYKPFNPPVVGKKCYYAYDNRTSRCPDCNAWRAIEKKEIIREKIYRRDPDDRDTWIEVYHFPLINPETGCSEGVILYSRDVTERHLAERALSDGDKFISEILSSIQDGISILDKDLNIVRVNNAMERWYSHALPLVGKKCYEAYHGRTEPCKVCPTDRALKSGKPEYNIVPKTGPDGEVVGWLDLFSFPIRNPRTVEIEGVIEYVRDVTDREKMRMAAEASHQQLESLFNSIDDPIHVFDPATYELLFINGAARELFGDVVGQKCYKALQGLDAPCPFCTNDKIFGENIGLVHISEQQNLLTKKWYRCLDRAINWPDNRIVGFSMSIDITDRKLAEERLKQANQKLSILGDITKHDTYNQLATIQGYVDFIRNTCQDKSVLQYLDRIADAAFSIQRQFEFVTEYQNIGVKGPEWLNVKDVFERASRDFKLENISIRNEIKDVEIFADPMVEKVFHNLIDNSVKHGKTLTEIRLWGEEIDNGYKITFEDNGVGFPSELKPVLFKTRIKGKSGFGLYLANQILAITGMVVRVPDGDYQGARIEIVAPVGKYRIRARKQETSSK